MGKLIKELSHKNIKLNIFFNVKGMSTIPEVLVACHCSISVFAFSLITNECIMEEECSDEIEHEKTFLPWQIKDETN